MPLESLLALVHKLRERIDTHGDKLKQSEALTRYALIDPLLRELGWDHRRPGVGGTRVPVRRRVWRTTPFSTTGAQQ